MQLARPKATASKRTRAIVVWALFGAFMGCGLGGLIYAALVHLIGPQVRGNAWLDWNLLFYALLFGLPLLLALLLAWAAFRATQRHHH